MKSRQINFFAMPDEWEPLEKYLEENGMICIPTSSETEEFMSEKVSENGIFKYFVQKEYFNNLKKYYLEETKMYYIDDTSSPVVRFIRSFHDNENKVLRRSKFYYTKGFWNDKDEWEEKPENFLVSADKLFKWFKKIYKNTKLPDWEGFIVTQNVKNKIKKNNLVLSQI